tara:strand:- start:24334 stop:25056 length:723 start_codon:yes stop_codon:yes gene_type:complete
MTDNLVKTHPGVGILRQKMDEQWKATTSVLTIHHPPDASVAPTIFVAKRYGGTGASMGALILEFLLQQEALIIEVGGNRCPAFKQRPPDRHAHFSSNGSDPIAPALDLRLAHPGRVAILEFEPALYARTLDIAQTYTSVAGAGPPMLVYICRQQEAAPRFAHNAQARGLGEPVVLREARQRVGDITPDQLPLPWLADAITNTIWDEGVGLEEALRRCSGSWTLQETRLNLGRFLNALLER